MKKYLLALLLPLLLPEVLPAQNPSTNRQVLRVQPRRSASLSAGLQLAVPTGEWADNYTGKPFGVNAALSLPLMQLPIEVGGGFAWNRMFGASQDVSISDGAGNFTPGDLRVNGNAYSYMLFGRLRPLDGKIRPYGELFAGVRNFSTNSKLKANTVDNPTTGLVDRNFTAIAGYAIGLKIELTPGVFAEGRFEKMAGSKADYIDPNSVVINPDASFTYSTLSSRTDQWAISLGIAFSF
jgi:hypothetical protein